MISIDSIRIKRVHTCLTQDHVSSNLRGYVQQEIVFHDSIWVITRLNSMQLNRLNQLTHSE